MQWAISNQNCLIFIKLNTMWYRNRECCNWASVDNSTAVCCGAFGGFVGHAFEALPVRKFEPRKKGVIRDRLVLQSPRVGLKHLCCLGMEASCPKGVVRVRELSQIPRHFSCQHVKVMRLSISPHYRKHPTESRT